MIEDETSLKKKGSSERNSINIYYHNPPQSERRASQSHEKYQRKLIQFSYTPRSLFDVRNPENLRRDVYGNIIFKGSKNHKVTFIDKIRKNSKISEDIKEENNCDNRKKRKSESCHCRIF